jgi:glycosyltransferase involved in cell wall biosynthesis
MKVKKMLSIIIPTYNSVKIISNTLDTLINQSSLDFELIFVDDGSTDNTICFISEKLINTEIKFKLIKNPDKGASQARNYGISKACGDKILFLDHDDLLLNHAVSQITNSFTSDNDILIFDY